MQGYICIQGITGMPIGYDEVEFAVEQYEKRRGCPPKILREDFCGTAIVASRWVKGHPERRAIGLDLDGPTLDWAREHNLTPLGEDRQRVIIIRSWSAVRVRGNRGS